MRKSNYKTMPWRRVFMTKREETAWRENFVKAHKPLVVYLARKIPGRGTPFEDRVQVGMIGLLQAMNRFDHKRGIKFATYAVWWIRQSINRFVASSYSVIRPTIPFYLRMNKIEKMRKHLESLNRDAGAKEIATELKCKTEKISFCTHVSKQISEVVSIDLCIWKQTKVPWLGEPKDCDPGSLAYESAKKSEVVKSLHVLNAKDRFIIIRLFGLDGDGDQTLSSIARVLGLSRERVRQRKNKALEKLREEFIYRRSPKRGSFTSMRDKEVRVGRNA